MINTVAMLCSLFGVIGVIVRAVMLDKTLPWFKPVNEHSRGAPRPKVRRSLRND